VRLGHARSVFLRYTFLYGCFGKRKRKACSEKNMEIVIGSITFKKTVFTYI
jgi:hypothetical protein